jgi:hypothetical protein
LYARCGYEWYWQNEEPGKVLLISIPFAILKKSNLSTFDALISGVKVMTGWPVIRFD